MKSPKNPERHICSLSLAEILGIMDEDEGYVELAKKNPETIISPVVTQIS